MNEVELTADRALTADRTIDVTGSYCPVPIVEAAREMKSMAPGELLLVVATDPGVATDFPMWCRSTRNPLVGLRRDGDRFLAWVRRRTA